MPVHYVFDADCGLLVVRYSGLVRPQEVVEATPDMGTVIGQSRSYAVLLLFDDGVDLSLIDFAGFKSIKQEEQEVIRRLGLDRRASAAVVGRKIDPLLLLPLWNALCAIDLDPAFQIPTFPDLDQALAALGVSPARGKALVQRLPPKEAASG